MCDLQDIKGVPVKWPALPDIVSPNKSIILGLPSGATAVVVGQDLLMLNQGVSKYCSLTDVDVGCKDSDQNIFFSPNGVASTSPDNELVTIINPDSTVFLHKAARLAKNIFLPLISSHIPGIFRTVEFGKVNVVWSTTSQAAVAWCGPDAFYISPFGCAYVNLHVPTSALAICAPTSKSAPDTIIYVEEGRGNVYTVDIADSTTPHRLIGVNSTVVGVVTHGPLVCLRTNNLNLLIIANIYEHTQKQQQLSTIQSSESGHCHFFTFGVSRASRVFNAIADPCIHPSGKIVCVPQDKYLLFVPLDDMGEPQQLVNIPYLTTGSPCALQWSPDGSRLAYINTRSLHEAGPPSRCVVTVEFEQGGFGLQFKRVCHYVDTMIDPEVANGNFYSASRIIWAGLNIVMITPSIIRSWPINNALA